MLKNNWLKIENMIYTKDHKTGYLFDPWAYLGPKRRKLMEESWAGLFRKEILNDLPESFAEQCQRKIKWKQ